MKEASERLKKKSEQIKADVKSLITDVSESIPRPLLGRPTAILKQPLLKSLRERMREQKKTR